MSIDSPARLQAFLISLFAIGVLYTAAPMAANASVPDGEDEGARVLRQLERGEVQCSELGPDDLEAIGDYAMARAVGSERGHEAMDAAMGQMMGERGEREAHIAMGDRYAGCGDGSLPAGFGEMMGAIDGMATMGGAERSGAYRRSMMIGHGYGDDEGGFNGPSAAAMIGVMAILIGAVAVAILWSARRRPQGPLDALRRRYAAGDIDSEEYQERKRILDGS